MKVADRTIVQLNERWRCVFEGRQWILEELKERKSKSEQAVYDDWTAVGYYSDLGALGRRILADEVGGLGQVDVAGFVQAVEYAEHRITRAIEQASGWPVRQRNG